MTIDPRTTSAPDDERSRTEAAGGADTVGSLMSRSVATIRDDQSLETALLMLKTTGLRHLVVVASDGAFAGVLSDRIGVECADLDARQLALARVRDLTLDRAAHTTEDRPLREAARIVLRQSAGALAVTDANARVTGIVTGADLLRGLLEIVEPLGRSDLDPR